MNALPVAPPPVTAVVAAAPLKGAGRAVALQLLQPVCRVTVSLSQPAVWSTMFRKPQGTG